MESEIIKTENSKTIEKISKTKSWFFKINKINTSLAQIVEGKDRILKLLKL